MFFINKDFLINKRWFQSKGKEILNVETFDTAKVSENFYLTIQKVHYKDGVELYFVPISLLNNSIEDAFFDPKFVALMNEFFEKNFIVRGEKGDFFFNKVAPVKSLSVKAINAGSTNTVSLIEKKEVVKAYRKLSLGENLEYSINKFLKKQNYFNEYPIATAYAAYRCDLEEYSIMLMTEFVEHKHSAWEEALLSVKNYLDTGKNSYAEIAVDLGRVVARMHRGFNEKTLDKDFSTEEITRSYLEKYANNIGKLFINLSSFTGAIKSEYKNLFEDVLSRKEEIYNALNSLAKFSGDVGSKTRTHGDFHLGQVLLKHDNSLCIIDFEGEPIKSVEERKEKFMPLRDIAGMLRSFHYAAFAHLYEYPFEIQNQKEKFAINWYEETSKLFLNSYRAESLKVNLNSNPSDSMFFEKLLAILKLEKAIYELNYEINNRPDWVKIPIKGIFDCLDDLKALEEVK